MIASILAGGDGTCVVAEQVEIDRLNVNEFVQYAAHEQKVIRALFDGVDLCLTGRLGDSILLSALPVDQIFEQEHADSAD